MPAHGDCTGVGAITALTFLTAIDDPERFRHSSDVGPFLTPRRYQSGEVDLAGRISKAGDRPARSLLFEAANALMTRVRHESSLRTLGAEAEREDRLPPGQDRRRPQARRLASHLAGRDGVRPRSCGLSFRRGGRRPEERTLAGSSRSCLCGRLQTARIT